MWHVVKHPLERADGPCHEALLRAPAAMLTEITDHAEQYSPDDNRFDLRQFLYPTWFDFKVIEKRIVTMGEVEQRGRKILRCCRRGDLEMGG